MAETKASGSIGGKMRLKLFTEKDVDRFYHGLINGTQNGMEMQMKHPVLYWVMLAFALAVLLLPLIMFFVWLDKLGYHAYQGLAGGAVAIFSVIASLCAGIALVNECMRVVDGYLGWKVTALCLLLGGGGMLLCVWLMPMVAA